MNTSPIYSPVARAAYATQAFGMLASLAFSQGLMLLYFTKLSLKPYEIMVFLSVSPSITGIALVPMAVLSERFAKKLFGSTGIAMNVIGFVAMAVVPWLPPVMHRFLLPAIMLCGLGWAMFFSVWWAILTPIFPAEFRGRFFGTLRITWQITGMLFFALVSALLARYNTLMVFQAILLAVAVALVVQYRVYQNIPEPPATFASDRGVREVVRTLLHTKNYPSFATYVFLVTLFTTVCPLLFGLIEKNVMRLNDNTVALLGVVLGAGNIAGFLVGGRLIDKVGTRSVFLVGHFSFAAIMLAFPLRGLMVVPVVAVGVLTFLFGMVYAAVTLAITTGVLALAPKPWVALLSSATMALSFGSASIAGFLAAGLIRSKILQATWRCGPIVGSRYDTILLFFGGMIAILVITLRLVPSVTGDHLSGGDSQ